MREAGNQGEGHISQVVRDTCSEGISDKGVGDEGGR